MSFLSDYTEKNSNLIPQIDIPCFAWNSQAEQGFLFFKAKSLSLGDSLQPWNYFAAHRVFIVATHHFIQIKIWGFETIVSLEFLYYI